jgi:hypothetical protein
MSASRLLHARDYRDFATLVREMDAALDFRKLRGRWNDERLQPFEAEYRFREAYRRVLELLDFVPREVGDDPKRASPICIHKQLPSVGTFDHTSTFEQTGRE